jgi:hypothetical protein
VLTPKNKTNNHLVGEGRSGGKVQSMISCLSLIMVLSEATVGLIGFLAG